MTKLISLLPLPEGMAPEFSVRRNTRRKWWLILKTIIILFNQAINICFFNINVRIYGRGVLWVFCSEWYFGYIYSSICQQTSILIKNTIWFLKKLGEEGEIQVNIIPHQVQGQKMPARSSPVVENTPSPRFPSYPTIFLPCYFPLLHPRGDICLQTDLFYATKARSTQNREYTSPTQARFVNYPI